MFFVRVCDLFKIISMLQIVYFNTLFALKLIPFLIIIFVSGSLFDAFNFGIYSGYSQLILGQMKATI